MAKGLQLIKQVALILLVAGLVAVPRFCAATDDLSSGDLPKAATESSLYVKVELEHPLKMSKLRPGDVVEGKLARDVYSENGKLFSTGSSVRLTVDHLEKRKRQPNDHWPWVVQAFTPRKENYPIFKSANIVQDNSESALQVLMISVGRMREIRPKAKKVKSSQQPPEKNAATSKMTPATPTMILEAMAQESQPSMSNKVEQQENSDRADSDSPETLPAGTHCKILLLGNVSASKSNVGDIVKARLLEPLLLNSKVVVPAGSLFDGKVVKKTPPRRLSRAGSLRLEFSGLTLPAGNRVAIAASMAGSELDEKSHTTIDAEGRLHGDRPGKAWMAINLGVTAGISKAVDDGTQLVIEALISAATDASTAGTSRIVSSCISGIYLATRHGRDVVLPRFTEMDISLDRAVSVNRVETMRASAALPGGK
jgi:hypothetical protein